MCVCVYNVCVCCSFLHILYIWLSFKKKKKELARNNLGEADTVVNELLIKWLIYKYDSVNYKHYIDCESDDAAD